jgi:hypothetical protein
MSVSCESEDEGDFVADEKVQNFIKTQTDQEFYSGTQEHDVGSRQNLESFVTPQAFDKSLPYRKNRLIISNQKMTKKVQTTNNSATRKHNMFSTSP